MRTGAAKRAGFKAILSLMLLCVLPGCRAEGEDDAVLHVLTTANYPPFSYYDKRIEPYEITGFEIELAQRIGQHLGKRVEIHDVDFTTLFPMIVGSKNTIALAALSITEGRTAIVDYSRPYYFSNIGVLRHRHSELDLVSSFAGKLGIVTGSSLAGIAALHQLLHPDLQVIYYQKLSEMLEDLLAYKLDGILLEETPAARYAQLYKWRMSFKPLQDTRLEYAVVLPKGSPLTARVNDILEQLQASDILSQMQSKWFAPKIHGATPEVAALLQ